MTSIFIVLLKLTPSFSSFQGYLKYSHPKNIAASTGVESQRFHSLAIMRLTVLSRGGLLCDTLVVYVVGRIRQLKENGDKLISAS
jgi:hypothetical protein